MALAWSAAGCAAGAGQGRSAEAELGPSPSAAPEAEGHGALRAAFCDRPISPRLRADLSALFDVPESRAQAEFCSRLDRAVASGRLPAGKAASLLRGDKWAAVDMLLILAEDGKLTGPEPVEQGQPAKTSEPARGDVGGRAAVAADPVSARQFVDHTIELADKFDAKLADLYSDAAEITNRRSYPDGSVQSVRLTGAEYKKLLVRSLPIAKRDKDHSIYSNFDVSVAGNKAFVKADRYSTLKCYTAKGYVVLERDARGQYTIVEEYGESQPHSSCAGA